MEKEVTWNVSLLSHLNHHTDKCELEVKKIIHLPNITNQLPKAFADAKKVTKAHITVANVPSRLKSLHNMLSLMNLEHARSVVD